MYARFVENLSLFTLIYLPSPASAPMSGWESFIIHLDILTYTHPTPTNKLRIFHYSPWYTYPAGLEPVHLVENLSLFTLIYLDDLLTPQPHSWESFIIHLDILISHAAATFPRLRIFHYSPWYTYQQRRRDRRIVENLSLFTLIYLTS